MTDAKAPGFDPRFHPAFQPGFDASASDAPVVSARERLAEYVPATAPPAAPVPRAVAPPMTAAQHPPATTIDHLIDGVTELEFEPEATRRPNPFLIALGALAVALIALGVYGVQWTGSLFTANGISNDTNYYLLQLVLYGAPVMVALGVAIGAGVLFLYAVAWQRR